LAPASAHFRATGLWSEAVFLKDTLALVGLEADFEAIAEYKVSPDMLRRSEMTAPHREMLESLLDSLYTRIINSIAQGRGLEPGRVMELMDRAPMTAQQALEMGLLDAVCYEDEIPTHLGLPDTLQTWPQVRRRLLRPRRWHSRKRIGIVSLEGTIVLGSSRQPPFPIPVPLPLPSVQAGSETIIQQLRSAAQQKNLAAVVLYVDSPGGSALASDLIWREVARLRTIKPVVVYMGNQAASGGYYVSAPANAIVCQPTTITGSIGIWGGKIVTRRLFAKIQAGRETVSRGKAAGLYADSAPFSDEERAKVRAEIGEGYSRFKSRVAEGRDKTDDEVEAISRGRVWTGEQALAIGLVDQLGDLQAAASLARELAGIDAGRYARLVSAPVPKRYQGPGPSPADASEWLANLFGLLREGSFALAPWLIRIRG
jgi:protease-4